MKNNKHKHLSIEDRIEIYECLNKGCSFKFIAKRIGKDPTTVSKEIKKHIIVSPSSAIHRDSSGNPKSVVCPKLLKAPFVCNSCSRSRGYCAYDKHRYEPNNANKEYRNLLVSSREGVAMDKPDFLYNDKIISECLQKGQHLYHVLKTYELNVSKSTVYRHFKQGIYTASRACLPRAVRFKGRRKVRAEYIPKNSKIGRTFNDFNAFCQENAVSTWVEMDTVIGNIGGKVLMTFIFTSCNFMFGLLLNNKTALEGSEKVIGLKRRLADKGYSFGEMIPLLLTDNGGEFAKVESFENNADGERETLLYFCDPYQSSQKPRVEKNHTILRDIAPKGTSFDEWTQETVNLVMSHVNGVKREVFNGKSPYEVFTFMYGKEKASAFGIEEIDAKDVIQNPQLLRKVQIQSAEPKEAPTQKPEKKG